MFLFLACTYLFENGTACHNSGFLRVCRDRFGVRYHPSLGVLLAVCHVSRVHVPFVMRCFFSFKKKQAAGPNILGATFSWRGEFEPRQAFLLSFFCLSFPFSFFPICFLNSGVFFSRTLRIHYTYLFGTAPLATTLACLPYAGIGFKYNYHPSLGACAVYHGCMCHV